MLVLVTVTAMPMLGLFSRLADERGGSSFIPHLGHWSAVSLTTSGCIGQA